MKKKESYSKYFAIIACVSVALMLISNITSIKLFRIGSVSLPAAILLFPVTYIIGDVVAEVYGYKKAKMIIYLEFLLNGFMVLFFFITIKLPAASSWQLQSDYQNILGTTPRLFIASLLGFLLGSLANASTLNIIKKYTGEKKLYIRTIGSTVVGELIDTLIFAVIAFIGSIPSSVLVTMIVTQYIWKVIYEAIATPITYLVINRFKKKEGE